MNLNERRGPQDARSRAPAGNSWPVLSALVLVILFLDVVALTWYLWRLPDASLTRLDKTLSTAGGWIAAAIAFFGIRSKVRRQPNWPRTLAQLPVVLVTVAATALVWFFVLPFHSLEIYIAGAEGPLDKATATLSGADSQIRGESGRDGVLRVPGLMAKGYSVVLARDGYTPKKVFFPFTDVIGFSRPGSVKLERVPLPPKAAAPDPLAARKRPRAGPLYEIRVESRPEGAEISVNQRTYGGAPVRLSLPGGEYLVTAHYGTVKQTKMVKPPEHSLVTFDFVAR